MRQMLNDPQHDDEANCEVSKGGPDEANLKERLLLNHQHVFIPQDQEEVLNDMQGNSVSPHLSSSNSQLT